MTNRMIIFLESQKLAKAGVIKYTGRTYKAINPAGEEVEVKETEPIHTYAAWREIGYQVQKGEKAIARFAIWKHVLPKQKDDSKDPPQGKMFLKTAAFFSASQVQKAG